MKLHHGYGQLLVLAPTAFALVRGLRQFLNLPARLPRWNKLLGYIWVPGVVLFAGAQATGVDIPNLDEIYWLGVLGVLAAVLLAVRDYRPARMLLLALGPILLYKIVELGAEGTAGRIPKALEDSLDSAQGFALLWMVAFIFIARSQKKNLEKDRLLREEEEKAKRLIEAQNVQLERVVGERTAALTHQAEELRGALTELRTTRPSSSRVRKWPAWAS